MADIRINALATTATTPASDDYLALDGTAQGTRKILATNIANNVTDVILGTSGPSVKSSLSARAPRQGLVFDGTMGAEISGPTLGAGDWTFSGWVYCKALGGSILGGANNSLRVSLRTSGAVFYGLQGGANSADTSTTLPVDKWSHLVITKSGTSGTVYLNGISIQTSTDNRNYSVAQGFVGSTSFATGDTFNGVIVPSIYNRALSASEVVALYEAGAPAGADYANAGQTINTSAFVTGDFGQTYDTFSGASATGFTAVYSTSGTQRASVRPLVSNAYLKKGGIIRVSFTATLTSGQAPVLSVLDSSGALIAGLNTVTAGSNSFNITITGTPHATTNYISFSNSAAASFAISNFVATPLGLLLAPDAAQAGGGLVWYDTSGNAANITLPASGVSWNVPFAGYIPTVKSPFLINGRSNGSSDLAVAHTTGNYGLNLITTGAGNTTLGLATSGGTTGVSLSASSGTASYIIGNLLVGASSPDGGQKLQVSGTAAISNLLTAAGASISGINAPSAGASVEINYGQISNSGRIFAYDRTGSAFKDIYLDGSSITLRSGASATTALTLDSSQNATFAGTVTATVNKSAANYTTVTTYVAAGSTTTTVHTFANANTNRSWLVSTRQQGAASNTVIGFATTYGGTLVVYRIAQSNTTGGVLDMNFTASGLNLQLVLGSGFGSTTWDTTITPIQG